MGRGQKQVEGQLSFEMCLDTENFVCQSNALVGGKQALKLNSAKLVRAAIMQIKPDDQEILPYKITISDLAKLLNVPRSNIYRDINEITDDIINNPVFIREITEKRTRWVKIPWVTICSYDSDVGVAIKLNDELKPFLLKATVWNWGNSVNTQDVAIAVSQPEHPLFRGLTLTNGQLQLFSQCNTNAVTCISEWYNTSVQTLASPVSQSATTTVAELPAGTNCNGTVLPKRLIMIGLSEYSTAYLTDQGKRLVENALLYQLGITPSATDITSPRQQMPEARKILQDGRIYILRNNERYTLTGISVPADR